MILTPIKLLKDLLIPWMESIRYGGRMKRLLISSIALLPFHFACSDSQSNETEPSFSPEVISELIIEVATSDSDGDSIEDASTAAQELADVLATNDLDQGDTYSLAAIDSTALSETAAAILLEVQTIQAEVQAALDSICARDTALIEAVKAEIQAIYDDTTLTREERRSAIAVVKSTYSAALQESKAAYTTCIAENQTEWDAVKLTFTPIRTACLGNSGSRGLGGVRVFRSSGRRGHHHLTAAELEALLVSDSCATAVAAYIPVSVFQ